jgi:hypothetical protein
MSTWTLQDHQLSYIELGLMNMKEVESEIRVLSVDRHVLFKRDATSQEVQKEGKSNCLAFFFF